MWRKNMTQHNYELVFATRPHMSEDESAEIKNKLSAIIEKSGGQLLLEENWGNMSTAYPMKKFTSANYYLFDFVGPAQLPENLEDSMRLDERVLRFLTVKLDDNVDLATAEEAAKSRQTQRVSDKKDSNSSGSSIDYKNPHKLRRHVTERGKIVPRRITNVTAKAQRRITLNIKRARQLALLPFLSLD
jgi:small subunit ribosomal protein S6